MNIHSAKWYALGAALIVLPQCDWFKKSETVPAGATEPVAAQSAGAQGDVLLTIQGKPVIRVADFEKYMNTILESQPQLKQLITLMPDAEYELFKNMANEEALKAWVKNNRIDEKESYKKDLQMLMDFGTRQLAIKHFQEAHPTAKVSDAELRKYYEDNKKTIPELMQSRGGVNATVAVFGKAKDAQDFLAKVRDQKVDFAKAAKEANATVKEYKQVSEHSFDVDAPVREKIITIKKFPSFELVTVKDKTYVIKAISKEEPTYVPFEQIKPRLEGFLNQQKAGESFAQDIEKLKKELNIEEAKEYFDRKKKVKEEEMTKAMEQAKGGQPMMPMPEHEAATAKVGAVKGA